MTKAEQRKDRHGTWRLMAEAERYVMVRRPGAAPVVMSRREWDAMPTPEVWDEVALQWQAHGLTP